MVGLEPRLSDAHRGGSPSVRIKPMVQASLVAAGLVPFTDERGLRDYRADVARPAAPQVPRGCLLVLAFLLGLAIGTQLPAVFR